MEGNNFIKIYVVIKLKILHINKPKKIKKKKIITTYTKLFLLKKKKHLPRLKKLDASISFTYKHERECNTN